jgi:hypothetical protein
LNGGRQAQGAVEDNVDGDVHGAHITRNRPSVCRRLKQRGSLFLGGYLHCTLLPR